MSDGSTKEWLFAELYGVLRRNPDRACSLFGQIYVIDHEDRVMTADLLVGLRDESLLQRGFVPDAGSDEVVQPLVVRSAPSERDS